MSEIRDAVTRLLADGWSVVPIVAGEKRPSDVSWLTKTYGPEDFAESDNVGVKNGEPSGHRIDIDCDAREAVEAAGALLPRTGLIHGRPGKPASHHWYLCPGLKSTQFKDLNGDVLLEIRGTGGQTNVPPSRHPSGERIAWESQRAPLTLAPDELLHAVRAVAIAALLARHWPGNGPLTNQHGAAGHVGGFLARCGFEPLWVEQIVRAAATSAGDEAVEDRARFARDSAEKVARGVQTTGAPRLKDDLAQGAEIVARICQWLGREGDSLIDELNEQHFVCRVGKDVVVAIEDPEAPADEDRIVFQTFETFNKLYYNRRVGKVRLGEFWLSHPHRRTYGKVVFAPPPLPSRPSDYNLWRGFAVTPDDRPAPETRCRRITQHLIEVLCNGHAHYAEYLLNLLAITVQRPGLPSGVAVVLRGMQGTGKGLFFDEVLGKIFGPHYVHLDKSEQLVGRFTGHLSGKIAVFADEAMWAGDRRDVGALRRLITERTLAIERKGVDISREHNCVHLFMATNESWVWPAAFRERRGFILDVSDQERPPAYFEALLAEIRSGGREAFLAYLLQRQVANDDWRKIPRTDALREQQEYSAEAETRWWKQKLYDGVIGTDWPTFIPMKVLYDDYVDVIGRAAGLKHRCLQAELQRKLAKMLPPQTPYVRRTIRMNTATYGDPYFTTQQVAGFVLPSITACRACFDRLSGTTSPWDADLPPVQEDLPIDPALLALTEEPRDESSSPF